MSLQAVCDGCGLAITDRPYLEFRLVETGAAYGVPFAPDGALHFHSTQCMKEFSQELHRHAESSRKELEREAKKATDAAEEG
jgi:hypothetical protein